MFKRMFGSIKTNLSEFRDFAFKGNLIQLAIAVVLGGAFGNLITSFVNNIFMPTISIPSRQLAESYDKFKHEPSTQPAAAQPAPAAPSGGSTSSTPPGLIDKNAGYLNWQVDGIKFGQFLGDMLSFLIVALSIFLLMVKTVSWISRFTKKAHASEPSEPTEKECPYCLMKVPYRARKCGHCTSDLPELSTLEPAT